MKRRPAHSEDGSREVAWDRFDEDMVFRRLKRAAQGELLVPGVSLLQSGVTFACNNADILTVWKGTTAWRVVAHRSQHSSWGQPPGRAEDSRLQRCQ